LRLIFLGSPPFALAVLERVLASSHEVLEVVTPPDRPAGRGRTVHRSSLAALAEARGISVLQPETTRTEAFVSALAAREPDVLLVASYGEILRENVLTLAPHGALNVHASLLPRWRGASPIQAAIQAGDTWTGVSIQRMVRALDAGDVLLEERTPIGAEETAGELTARLAALGGDAAVRALDELASGTATFTPQDPAGVTFARKLEKDAGRIVWSKPAAELARLVRAMNPWPLARTRLPDGERELAILRARAATEECGASLVPGTLLDSRRFLVQTGTGALELLAVQPAGKPEMDGAAFLRGARLVPPARLG
jgi:methionyl-tRNA formyltransferase